MHRLTFLLLLLCSSVGVTLSQLSFGFQRAAAHRRHRQAAERRRAEEAAVAKAKAAVEIAAAIEEARLAAQNTTPEPFYQESSQFSAPPLAATLFALPGHQGAAMAAVRGMASGTASVGTVFGDTAAVGAAMRSLGGNVASSLVGSLVGPGGLRVSGTVSSAFNPFLPQFSLNLVNFATTTQSPLLAPDGRSARSDPPPAEPAGTRTPYFDYVRQKASGLNTQEAERIRQQFLSLFLIDGPMGAFPSRMGTETGAVPSRVGTVGTHPQARRIHWEHAS